MPVENCSNLVQTYLGIEGIARSDIVYECQILKIVLLYLVSIKVMRTWRLAYPQV